MAYVDQEVTGLYKPGLKIKFELFFAGATEGKKAILERKLKKFSRILLGIAKTESNSSKRILYETYFISVAGSLRIIKEEWGKTFWHQANSNQQSIPLKPSIKQFAAEIGILEKHFASDSFPEVLLPRAREIKQVFVKTSGMSIHSLIRNQLPELEALVQQAEQKEQSYNDEGRGPVWK